MSSALAASPWSAAARVGCLHKKMAPAQRCSTPAWVPHSHTRRVRCSKVQGVGKDAMGSWLDLASFVAKGSSGRTPFDELADKIGRDVYIDVAGWHLYLKDVKLGGQLSLAQGLAQQLGVQIEGSGYQESEVVALLGRVPVTLGLGKATLPLSDVLPASAVRDLTDICEEYARRR